MELTYSYVWFLMYVFWMLGPRSITGVPGCSMDSTRPLLLTADTHPGRLVSPNHPRNYGEFNQRLCCYWLIRASPELDDVILQVRVHNSSMEPSTACVRDSATIIDGSADFHRQLETWCGRNWPSSVVTTTGREALIMFETNFVNNDYPGFILYFWAVKRPIVMVRPVEWKTVNYVLLGISGALVSLGSTIFTAQLVKKVILPWGRLKLTMS